MKNLVSIFAGHDANISFYSAKEDKYYTIEIERLVKKRYFRLHVDNDEQTVRDILFECRNIAATEWVSLMIMRQFLSHLMVGLIHHPSSKRCLIQSL